MTATTSDPLGIEPSTYLVAEEVASGRWAAHEKHGDNSIEALHGHDPRWLPILVEEVGEAAHELTYDAHTTLGEQQEALRKELVDVATVAIAWIAAIDRDFATSEVD